MAFPRTVRGRKRGTGFLCERSDGVVHDQAERFLRVDGCRGVVVRRIL